MLAEVRALQREMLSLVVSVPRMAGDTDRSIAMRRGMRRGMRCPPARRRSAACGRLGEPPHGCLWPHWLRPPTDVREPSAAYGPQTPSAYCPRTSAGSLQTPREHHRSVRRRPRTYVDDPKTCADGPQTSPDGPQVSTICGRPRTVHGRPWTVRNKSAEICGQSAASLPCDLAKWKSEKVSPKKKDIT